MFKKVLNSETKESTEEIFRRLEMICESVTEKVLEYVCPRYTTQTSHPARRPSFSRVNTDTIGREWTDEFDLNALRVDGERFASDEKKLRIQKYPDTCRRALKQHLGQYE